MRIFLAPLAAALMLGSVPLAAQPMPIAGGWSSAPVDAQARKAAQFALSRLKRGTAKIRSIDAVERQVVAGTNYRIRMTLTDRTRWDVVVWQRLNGTYRLTSARRVTAAAAAQSQIRITGAAAYRERMALPPGSRVIVTLADVSRADAPAIVLARQTIVTKGEQVPIRFALTVDRARLPGPMRNSVSVRIEDASGRLMWITDTMNPVEYDERGSSADLGTLMLVRAGG